MWDGTRVKHSTGFDLGKIKTVSGGPVGCGVYGGLTVLEVWTA